MPRRPRACPPGYAYHVLNRGVGRMKLFEKAGDYEAFERALLETRARFPGVELFAYCLMPNHWHLMLRPAEEGQLSEFMRLLTVTHTQRWHAHRRSSGTGPVYQGRFKSFPVEAGDHFLVAARYVERNPLRARLAPVGKALSWRWSSLWARRHGDDELRAVLSPWPIPRQPGKPGPMGEPAGWLRLVNRAQTQAELDALRLCVKRGRPLGSARWTDRTAAKLGLASTLRPVGRPRKAPDPGK